MNVEERLAILKQVESIAALAGLRGQINDDGDRFIILMDTGDNRSQQLFVKTTGRTPEGKAIVTFSSAARMLKKGLLSGFSRDDAIELLRINENTFFARFGIVESDKAVLVLASSDAILDTLDAEEMRAHVYYVAYAADAYEKKHGGEDRF